MTAGKLLECEERDREFVILSVNGITIAHAKNQNIALTLPEEVLNKKVLRYDSPIDRTKPVKIVIAAQIRKN